MNEVPSRSKQWKDKHENQQDPNKDAQESKHQFRNLDSRHYHFSSPLATHEEDGGGGATSLVRFIDFLDDPECKGRDPAFF